MHAPHCRFFLLSRKFQLCFHYGCEIFVHCHSQWRWPLGIDSFSQQKTGPTTTYPYSGSSCRTSPYIEHILVQWKFLIYRQTGGVAMGSRLGPNYACLFMGHSEEQIFDQYTGMKPAPYKRYIDGIAGATSGSREERKYFATYVNGFHPSLNFTWVISDVQLPFLDLCLKPTPDRLLTSIYYKEIDTHSYLNYTSSHTARCKNSIPYSQFLRLRRICSENDFEIKSKEMASFFRTRGYPSNKVQRAQERVSAIPRDVIISERSDVPDAQPIIPLVLTYHSTNALVKNIMTRNFHLLRDDPDTRDIYRP